MDPRAKSVIRVIVVSLLLDLLAFTLPLPLFPRIVEGYIAEESIKQPGQATLLTSILRYLATGRAWLQTGQSSKSLRRNDGVVSKSEIVLLGGLLGSIFSLCQYIVSPYIGSLSDSYGRRRTLLLTMGGNILSSLMWVFSPTFAIYLLSRIVGGLSEGNVQLSIAIISDVTNEKDRARALALVGMCFAVAFSTGPPLGAYLANHWQSWTDNSRAGVAMLGGRLRLTDYAIPAITSVVLLLVETLYLAVKLPETKDWSMTTDTKDAPIMTMKTEHKATRSLSERKRNLKQLERILLAFSFIFSGAEFTLTFLTYDLFSYTNSQNGRLLGAIGVISSLAQGGIVRRQSNKIGSGPMARTGLLSCAMALALLAYLPLSIPSGQKETISQSGLTSLVLWSAAACFAWSSASVVNSLNALASLECDASPSSSSSAASTNGEDGLPKGRTLGKFRSSGQLGRAGGPLTVTALYWLAGPTATYALTGTLMVLVWLASKQTLQKSSIVVGKKTQ